MDPIDEHLGGVLRDESGMHLPSHVLERIAFLLAEEPPVHVSIGVQDLRDVGDGSGRGLAGTIVVFTGSRVIECDLEGTAHDPTGAKATVDVSSWSRRTLVSIDLPKESGPIANYDEAWDSHVSDLWPRGASLSLGYSNGRVLRLPLDRDRTVRSERARMIQLTPSLVEDLRSS